MIKIVPEMRQILIDPAESSEIREELVAAFISLDKETTGDRYSGNNMEAKYPKLWEFYCKI